MENKTVTIQEIRAALVKHSWNENATKKGVSCVLVTYPNDILSELFGEELTKKYWIPDVQKQEQT